MARGRTELLASQILVRTGSRNWRSSNPACMCWPPRELLQNGDLQRFHQIARAALQSPDHLRLCADRPRRAAGGQYLAPLRQAPRERAIHAAAAEVLATGRTVLTGLLEAPGHRGSDHRHGRAGAAQEWRGHLQPECWNARPS